MSSSANASNGGNVAQAKAPIQGTSAGRPTMKATTSGKPTDGSKKQSSVSAEGAQRSSTTKAWGSGTNPITQKPTVPAHINGATTPRPVTQNAKESGTADQHAHDRLLFICAASIGQQVTITTKNGDAFRGVMSSSSLTQNDQSVTLKMVRQADAQANGAISSIQPFIGAGPDHAMSFDLRDVTDWLIPELSFAEIKKIQNGASSGFRTDTDISGNREAAERKLQRWVPDANVGPDLSLESNSTGAWDQFAENERKFGMKSTYDENLYTTAINKNDPSYREREAAAAKLAREIEGATSANAHVREERGQAFENDVDDEEAKYSGVRRGEVDFPPLSTGRPNAYTPPARRAPTGQPTVAGAPVDPAIISAQLSRPDGSKQPKIEQTTTDGPGITAPAQEKTVSGDKLGVIEPTLSAKAPSVNNSVSPHRKIPETDNATEGVEEKLLHQFRTFATAEKAKVQERRRAQLNHDRTAKLNDLLRFSKTFQLKTPVPKDLVPILAKDPDKQEEIIEKAQKQMEEKKTSVTPAVPASSTASPAGTPDIRAPTRPAAAGGAPSVSLTDRQATGRGRQGYPPTGPTAQSGRGQQAIPSRGPSGYMNHRMTMQPGKPIIPATVPTPIPIDARITPNGPSVTTSGLSSPQRSAMQTPNSAVSTKFNAAALEFRPNPSASSFNPAGSVAASSPPSTTARTRSVSRAPSPVAFFKNRKPMSPSERPKFSSFFNPIKRMKKEAEDQGKTNEFTSNGGIPQPYRTPVRWDVPEANTEKTYRDMIERSAPPPSASPSARSVSSSTMPHQHQLPAYLQNGGPGTPQAPPGPQAMQNQHSHQGHFDDHHRMTPGGGPHVYPSPRVGQAHVMYPSPMAGQAQIYGQPNPQYFPQSQMAMQMRYPGAPPFVQQQAVPMMTTQSQTGHYMAVPQQFTPQMQMYSPSPGQAYPTHVAPQSHSGYPSPGRGAPMMMHQSSQGHHPPGMMYVGGGQHGQTMYSPQQPQMHNVRPGYPTPSTHYSSSPHQPHHFPPQPHRAPSNQYGHTPMPQKTPQHMTSQPQAAPAMPSSYSNENIGEEGGK